MERKINSLITSLIEESMMIVDKYISGFKDNACMDFTELKNSYNRLRRNMGKREIKAYNKIVNNIVVNVLFSIMVLLEGGEEFNDRYILDIVDVENNISYMFNDVCMGLSDEFMTLYLEYNEKEGKYEES